MSGNHSLHFTQLKVRGSVSKEHREQIEGTAVSVTVAFRERESENFLTITALILILNVGWFLPQGEQVGTWNSKMENARSEVTVESIPITCLSCILALQVSSSPTKTFFEHFLLCESSNIRYLYC